MGRRPDRPEADVILGVFPRRTAEPETAQKVPRRKGAKVIAMAPYRARRAAAASRVPRNPA